MRTLSVLQNLMMGAYTRRDKNEIEETLKMIYKRFPRLEEEKEPAGGNLIRRRAADACHGPCSYEPSEGNGDG